MAEPRVPEETDGRITSISHNTPSASEAVSWYWPAVPRLVEACPAEGTPQLGLLSATAPSGAWREYRSSVCAARFTPTISFLKRSEPTFGLRPT